MKEFDEDRIGLKVQLKDLLLKRESIEGDIALRSERLEASGVGRTQNLVDKEGYPRSDIDVAAVRSDRQRIAGGMRSMHTHLVTVHSRQRCDSVVILCHPCEQS